MGGKREQDILGMDAPFAGRPAPERGTSDPIGMSGGEEDVVTHVVKDYDVKKLVSTPAPDVKGKTIAKVRASLKAIPSQEFSEKWLKKWGEKQKWGKEWGKGGASIDVQVWVQGKKCTATLSATFIRVLPNWTDEAAADTDPEAKALWETMIGHLKKHEQRHVELTVPVLDWLAEQLVGLKVSEIAQMQDGAIFQMEQEHEALDDPEAGSDYGRKPGHKYGNVVF